MTEPETPIARRARLFLELCDLGEAERRAALDRIAATEERLAADLERMFALDDRSLGPIEALRGEVAAAAERQILAQAPDAAPPARLGAWRLGERLGQGGMGEVWAAERVEGGFTQRAALKLVRSGMASGEVVRRFAVERQLLARLEHPAIAKLMDGGVAPDGRPWFAMERVDGVPLTRYAGEHALDLEARLRLFLGVCDAVDFAHRSLVVHRDLKPSNILVSRDGAPKLLDFGLAKLVEVETAVDGDPHATRTEFRALTPAYAAPEQIVGEPVGTATDVYALGVILFELLTGELPHRRKVSSSATTLVDDVARETVERPSHRLQRRLREAPARPAGSVRPKRLEGDLDTIVLKALAREPARRYPSAAALAADLVAHLERRPISARPDSLGYRAGKFVRRHRLAVAATALVIAAIVSGAVVALVQAQRAQREARRAERVKTLLADVFLGADPERSKGGEITARELLADGTRKMERELAGEPEVQADLLATVAHVEDGLGLLEPGLAHAEKSLALAERAWGPESERLLEPLAVLGGLLLQLERDDEALAVKSRALEIARRRFAPASLEVADAEYDYVHGLFAFDRYAESLPLIEGLSAVRERALGRDHPETIEARLTLAFALDYLDRYDEAIEISQEVLASYQRSVGPDDPRVAEAHHNLAVSLAWVARNEEALEHFAAAIELRRRILGPGDFRVGWSLQQSSHALRDLERYDEADAASREALAIFLAIDPNYAEATNCRLGLGRSDLARGRYREASEAFRRATADWTAQRGPEHRSTLQARAMLALARVEEGGAAALDEAAALARSTLAARIRVFGEEAAYTAHSWFVLGEVERARGDLAAAKAAHGRALAIDEKLFAGPNDATLWAMLALALDHLAAGTADDLAAAEKLLDRAADGQKDLDPEHSFAGRIDLARARLARARGDTAEAARLASAASSRIAARLGAGHPLVAECDRLLAGAGAS